MRMDEVFEVAGGSVAGRTHAVLGKPNQDAFAIHASEKGILGVVCDGCGSGAKSEVGASLGARIVAGAMMAEIEAGADIADDATLERIRAKTLAALAPVVSAMGENRSRIVSEFFLFTVLGVAASRERAVVFGIGDGIFSVGDDITKIGPFPGNAPPYLGYGLLADGPPFVLHRKVALETLESALVGTDGASDYEALSGASRPGGLVVAPLPEMWRDDRYFRNEDAIRRALFLVNREVTRPSWAERRLEKDPGLLEDDTTMIVLRRKKRAA